MEIGDSACSRVQHNGLLLPGKLIGPKFVVATLWAVFTGQVFWVILLFILALPPGVSWSATIKAFNLPLYFSR